MPQKRGTPKTVLLVTRVTPRIRNIVVQIAHREGLNVSEGLHNLMIGEFKRTEALPTLLHSPDFRLELDEDE